MRFGSFLVTLLLAAGLLGPATSPATAAEAPYRDFDIDVGHAQIEQFTPATVNIYGETNYATSGHLQQKIGKGAWTNLGPTFAIPATGDDWFETDQPIPTDTVGAYRIRLVLDADANFPRAEAGYAADVTIVQAPPKYLHDSTITASDLSASNPGFGQRVTLNGRVSGGFARKVEVQLDTPTGWMPIGATTSDAGGAYTLTVPTDWYYSGKIRAAVPEVRIADDLYHAAASPTLGAITVKVPYKPRGNASDWVTFSGGHRVEERWNPCEVIDYKVNVTGAPKGALAMTQKALRIVTAATGLRFNYEGATTAIPYRTDHGREFDNSVPFVIAWAGPRQVHAFTGRYGPIGLGGNSSMGGTVTDGEVSVDRTWKGKPGFKRGATFGSLLLHEIGHAIGLDHAHGNDEVMFGTLMNQASGWYEAGDLAGLSMLGASRGCPTAPEYASRRDAQIHTFVSD